MYKVYIINPLLSCYCGASFVAAKTAQKANEFIKSFKKSDPDNKCNSYGYSFVDEEDALNGIYSDDEGIVHMGISYSG